MKILFVILVLEYVVIMLILIGITLFKIIEELKLRKEEAYKKNLENMMKRIIVKEKRVEDFQWEKGGQSIPAMVDVLEAFDVRFKSEIWDVTKAFLAENYLLPWAREHINSFFWEKRSLSARIFLLHPIESDIPVMKIALNDPGFFIRMIAVAALSKLPSIEIIGILIESMAEEAPPARFPYRHSILAMPLESQVKIADYYFYSEKENVRLACLDLMSHYFVTVPLHGMRKDYRSKNKEMRVLITRILGNLSSDEAVRDLIEFLNDSDPDVRTEALLALGKVKSEASFDHIVAKLQDPDYKVRLHAALALDNFGKRGIDCLQGQDWDLDPKAYEVARYVLTRP